MIDPEKIKQRLEKDYEHVKTFITGKIEEPVFFACNFDDATFLIVSVYLDSEIGGHFTLNHVKFMEEVYEDFDAEQAEELREDIISKIRDGDAVVVGDINPKKLH